MNAVATELALCYPCGDGTAVAIAHLPAAPASVGVIIIVGGPQYRAGSHRQFVLLGRALAAGGFASLRFDARGMGDSGGDRRGFEEIDADIAAAIDALLARVPQVRHVVLWGLCDAASAALLYLHGSGDARVRGLCLLNPHVRSEQSLARTHVRHYYLRRLRERAFWAKLLRGGVGLRALRGLIGDLGRRGGAPQEDDSYRTRMRRAWAMFRGDILLVLSGADLTAREFADTIRTDKGWAEAVAKCRPCVIVVADADHTLSDTAQRVDVEQRTVQWLRDRQADAAVRPGAGR